VAGQRWFAVRTLVRHEAGGQEATFEERIHLYKVASADAAAELAKRECPGYMAMNEGFVQVKQVAVFELGHGDADLHGREVWSHLSRGPADPKKFYREKFGKFELEPET